MRVSVGVFAGREGWVDPSGQGRAGRGGAGQGGAELGRARQGWAGQRLTSGELLSASTEKTGSSPGACVSWWWWKRSRVGWG